MALLAILLIAMVALIPREALAQAVELPVPRVTIYPGEAIESGHLTSRAFVARTVARTTIFNDTEAVVGKVALRTLIAGQPIPLAAVRDAYVITQGKTATVIFQEGGLSLTAQAVALSNGGIGDVISLRNPDSGVTIKGTVAADGTIRLGGP
jgi:flagella basal body P-ring formation protein FlgA